MHRVDKGCVGGELRPPPPQLPIISQHQDSTVVRARKHPAVTADAAPGVEANLLPLEAHLAQRAHLELVIRQLLHRVPPVQVELGAVRAGMYCRGVQTAGAVPGHRAIMRLPPSQERGKVASMGTWVHRTEWVDEEAKAGICTHCGPVEMVRRKIRDRVYWQCRIANAEQKGRKGRHGLLRTEAQALREGKACVLCGSTTDLVVDHDHGTMEIRGVLCRLCNLGLGYFRDDPEVLLAAVNYLQNAKKDPKPPLP